MVFCGAKWWLLLASRHSLAISMRQRPALWSGAHERRARKLSSVTALTTMRPLDRRRFRHAVSSAGRSFPPPPMKTRSGSGRMPPHAKQTVPFKKHIGRTLKVKNCFCHNQGVAEDNWSHLRQHTNKFHIKSKYSICYTDYYFDFISVSIKILVWYNLCI